MKFTLEQKDNNSLAIKDIAILMLRETKVACDLGMMQEVYRSLKLC